MIQVDDLNRTGEMFFGDVPDPFRTIADDNFLLCAAPTALPGFDIKSLAELLRTFDGSGVGCRIEIANRKAFFVPASLREHTAELGLPGMRGQAIALAFAVGRFLLHHGQTGAVHLHIEDGDGFANDDGQIELHRAVDLLLLAFRNIGPDGFSHAFHGFGGDLQAGQQFHLLATVIEGCLLAHQSLHSSHTGREFRIDQIEFLISGKLPLMTVPTQIPGP